jgi:hypothetical protein
VCSRCKKTIDVSHTLEPNYCGGSGYGYSGNSKRKVCYDCCAVIDSKHMDKHGEMTLYLSDGDNGFKFKITNWPEQHRPCQQEQLGSLSNRRVVPADELQPPY